jgi:hypothetical protein
MKLSDSDQAIYSWLLLNVPFFLLLGAGFITGYIQPVFHDVTFLTHGIFIIFLGTLLHTGWIALDIAGRFRNIKTLQIEYHSHATDRLGDAKDLHLVEFERVLMFTKFSMNLLVGLGFLGTVVGVIIGFQHFPAEAFSDLTKMQEFVRMMLTGFATELHTLLMGLLGKLWLSVVVFTLEKQFIKLFAQIIS